MTLLTWPNAISLLRLPLAAAFVTIDSTPARVGIAVAAGLSDMLDGKLARSRGMTSRAGELLDPMTDRIFVLGALGTFVLAGELRGAELVLLTGRDIYTALAFAIGRALHLPIRFHSRPSGKVVTALQVSTVVSLLLLPEWARTFIMATGAAGAYAIVDYTRAGLSDLRGHTATT
jgi:phosphatidylglycerophosphate synthase